MIDPISLVICIPTAGKVHVATAYSIAGMIAKLAGGIRTRPDTPLDIGFDFQASSVLTTNRELLARRAVDSGKTHLMFLDDDMGFGPEVLELMLGRRQPVVATNYLIKKQAGEDPTFVAVDLFGRRIATTKETTGLQEISYSGFGVSLFETQVFKAVPQPWFAMEFVPEASSYTTEDNPFFAKVRAAGFSCYIDHDASKMVTHNGDFIWRWDQWTPPKAKDDWVCVNCGQPRDRKTGEAANKECPGCRHNTTDVCRRSVYERMKTAPELKIAE